MPAQEKLTSWFKQTFQVSNRFQQLGSNFYQPCQASPITNPKLVCYSPKVAELTNLSVEQIGSEEFLQVFSGQPIDNLKPIAHQYAGHQFGKFNHFLGDGRSLHLAEIIADRQSYDLCLKGAGKTPYSRFADGRATLESCLHEFTISATLDQHNIPTCQNLCVIVGDEKLARSDYKRIGILTRLAPSFIRFGHFENQYYSGNKQAVKQLADFVIKHHYPNCKKQNKPYAALLREVIQSTVKMVAHWQAAGFIHGTMNTDNHSVLGITLDMGASHFMQRYQPDLVVDCDDEKGLFAFEQQPAVGLWNCNIFARTLTDLIARADIEAALSQYETQYQMQYQQLMCIKLGLSSEQLNDRQLVADYLDIIKHQQLDYSESFIALSSALTNKNQDLIPDYLNTNNFYLRYLQCIKDEGADAKTAADRAEANIYCHNRRARKHQSTSREG